MVEYGTNASPFATLKAYVLDGFGSPATGIISTARDTVTGLENTLHAVIDNATVGVSTAVLWEPFH